MNHYCKRCGGILNPTAEMYICAYCQAEYAPETAERHTATLEEQFDRQKQEHIHNRRRVLYDAVTAQYISREDVVNACDALRQYLPEDFAANFYRVASGEDGRALNQAIRAIKPEACYDEMETVIRFLIKSLSENTESILALGELIERTYRRRDLALYNKYTAAFNEQAELTEEGVFVADLPRDVFIAYSSKDMAAVTELMEALEEQGITCFVAARNLQHGVGAKENYDSELKKAMDACRTVVFVSSMNSRNLGCDALKIELPYIQNQDIRNGPPQYHGYYDKLPHMYKKPRVEYRIEDSTRFNVADRKVELFFAGYEWVTDIQTVIERVAEHIYADPEFEEEELGHPTEEELRRRIEEEVRREYREQEEKNRLRLEEDARRKAEEDACRKAEEDRKRKEAEEEARRRVEEDRKRREEQEKLHRAQEKAIQDSDLERRYPVGSTVKLGYYRKTTLQGTEPIEWQILAREGNRALVLSKAILACQPYHARQQDITWESCDLRRWLNSTFFNTAFSSAARDKILTSHICNSKNAGFGISGGNDTEDKIFCLSIGEVQQYMTTNRQREAKATVAVQDKDAIYVNSANGNSWWWLRSPGSRLSNAANVSYDGSVYINGNTVNSMKGGVRPAMWIDLSVLS